MFIREIVIDGFKSYAQRTVISGFDKQFNAITGRNGSGKSNILDSICFLLGISNLSQVSEPQCPPAVTQTHALPSNRLDHQYPLTDAQPLITQNRSELATCRSWCTSRARQVLPRRL